MADDDEKKKKGISLTKVFTMAAGFALTTAFGFYVMGAFDFTLFHNMVEGEFFMERSGPWAAGLLRADIPILGFSIADTFVKLGSLFPVPTMTGAEATDALDMLDGFSSAADGASGSLEALDKINGVQDNMLDFPGAESQPELKAA